MLTVREHIEAYEIVRAERTEKRARVERLPIWARTRCEVCHELFTEDGWETRHDGPNGEEWHDYCCPTCEAGDMHDMDEENE